MRITVEFFNVSGSYKAFEYFTALEPVSIGLVADAALASFRNALEKPFPAFASLEATKDTRVPAKFVTFAADFSTRLRELGFVDSRYIRWNARNHDLCLQIGFSAKQKWIRVKKVMSLIDGRWNLVCRDVPLVDLEKHLPEYAALHSLAS